MLLNILFYVLVALLGGCIGYGINYVSDVLPFTRRFTPVTCLNCQNPVGLSEYLLLRPCRCCGQRRSLRTWVVQIAAPAALLALWRYTPGRLEFWPGLILLAFFGVVVVIDFEHRLILHPVSLVGAVIGAGFGIWWHGWLATLLGGLAGFGIMLALFYLGALFAKGLGKLRGQEIEEDALGFGDVNLSGVIGLLLGWPGIIAGLTFAILLGGAGSLIVLVYSLVTRRYQAFQAIPYGPFLAAGAILALILK